MTTAVRSRENGEGCSFPRKWKPLFVPGKMRTAVRSCQNGEGCSLPRKWLGLFAGQNDAGSSQIAAEVLENGDRCSLSDRAPEQRIETSIVDGETR
jgi:hypothetical protein